MNLVAATKHIFITISLLIIHYNQIGQTLYVDKPRIHLKPSMCEITMITNINFNIFLPDNIRQIYAFNSRIYVSRFDLNYLAWRLSPKKTLLPNNQYAHSPFIKSQRDEITKAYQLGSTLVIDVLPYISMNLICGISTFETGLQYGLNNISQFLNHHYCFNYSMYGSPTSNGDEIRMIRLIQNPEQRLKVLEFYDDRIFATIIPDLRIKYLSGILYHTNNLMAINMSEINPVYLILKDCSPNSPNYLYTGNKLVYMYERYLCQMIENAGFYNMVIRLSPTYFHYIRKIPLHPIPNTPREIAIIINGNLEEREDEDFEYYDLFEEFIELKSILELPMRVPFYISNDTYFAFQMKRYVSHGICNITIMDLTAEITKFSVLPHERVGIVQNVSGVEINITSLFHPNFDRFVPNGFLVDLHCGNNGPMASIFYKSRQGKLQIKGVYEYCS